MRRRRECMECASRPPGSRGEPAKERTPRRKRKLLTGDSVEQTFEDRRTGSRGRARTAGPGTRTCLDDGWCEPEARLSPRARSEVQRARKAADALGGAFAEIRSPIAEDLQSLFDAVNALTGDPNAVAFQPPLCGGGGPARESSGVGFRIGERIAASLLAVEVDNRLWAFELRCFRIVFEYQRRSSWRRCRGSPVDQGLPPLDRGV